MIKIVDLNTIKSILPKVDLINEIEKGFVAYSNGEVVVPPVGELSFDSPPGDVHIKYGYIKNDDIYVIKIASGFYKNSEFDLPTGNGMIIVFDQRNGRPIAVLNDFAVASAVMSKFLKAIASCQPGLNCEAPSAFTFFTERLKLSNCANPSFNNSSARTIPTLFCIAS